MAALTGWLEARGAEAFAAMMLDLYPKGRLSEARYAAGQDPVEALPCFDAGNYRTRDAGALWQCLDPRRGQGTGVLCRRARAGAASAQGAAGALALAPCLAEFDPYRAAAAAERRGCGGDRPTGVLLHTKFLPGVAEKSAEEMQRRQHFTHVERYGEYYGAILADPDLRGEPRRWNTRARGSSRRWG